MSTIIGICRFMASWKRDQCLRTRQPQRLQFIMYDTQQMVIVLSVNLDKHIIFTSSEMTLYYFRNGFQSSRYRIKDSGSFRYIPI